MPTIEETVKAILDNPIEALSRKHANYKAHRRNTEYLVLKGIISKNSDEYIFTKEELKKFLKNKCRVPQEITENREKKRFYFQSLTLFMATASFFASIVFPAIKYLISLF